MGAKPVGTRRFRTRLLGPAVGAVGVIGLLLAASGLGPVAGSAPTMGAANFRGSSHTDSYTLNPLLAGPCGFAMLSHPILWHASRGTGGWAERVRANGGPTCTGVNGSSYAAYPEATATITIAVPIGSPNASGNHTVTANWTFRYTGMWDESHGGCPSVVVANGSGYQDCAVMVGFTVQSSGFPRLIDLSTGNFVNSYSVFARQNGTEWVRDTTCSAAPGPAMACTNITADPSAPQARLTEDFEHTISWNQTYLNASHTYAIQCTFLGSVYADTSAYPQPWDANATASLNLEGYGDSLTLDAITIT